MAPKERPVAAYLLMAYLFYLAKLSSKLSEYKDVVKNMRKSEVNVPIEFYEKTLDYGIKDKIYPWLKKDYTDVRLQQSCYNT